MHKFFKVKTVERFAKGRYRLQKASGDEDVANGLPHEKEYNTGKHSKIKSFAVARTPFREDESKS